MYCVQIANISVYNQGTNMTIFENPDFYYNDLTHLITNEIITSIEKGISGVEGYARWKYPIFIDAEDDLIDWRFVDWLN